MPQKKKFTDERPACQKRLERLWKTRMVDDGLLHKAWHTAYRVATLLYEQLGATQVVVFGSLTEPMWFTDRSDIDIAVSGLSDDAYDKARSAIWDFKSGFKIDIINFDRSKGLFRERIKYQAIPIEKGGATGIVADALRTPTTTGFPYRRRRHLRNEPKKTHTTH